jgi:hypothetical protein
MPSPEPPSDAARGDDDYLLLFQRLLQRFSEHARALAALDARIAELTQVQERQATELAALRAELSRSVQEDHPRGEARSVDWLTILVPILVVAIGVAAIRVWPS